MTWLKQRFRKPGDVDFKALVKGLEETCNRYQSLANEQRVRAEKAEALLETILQVISRKGMLYYHDVDKISALIKDLIQKERNDA